MPDAVPPARPHLQFTDDGRRLRQVLTYSRRGSRFTPSQQESWDAHHQDWVIEEQAVDQPGFDLAERFGRVAPLIIEIGSGIGEATAALAAGRPDHNILALEVWMPGVAHTLGLLEAAGADNVRLLGIDAIWSLENLVDPGSLSELWTFFPDPWPKTKHHKRRLINAEFARLVVSRLQPGACWRLATDWAEYADQMIAVLDAEPGLSGGRVERWTDRPVTKFERKGVAVERDIVDLTYVRKDA